MADEIELTELTDIQVIRQDAVKSPASGFRFLIQKSTAAAAEDCGTSGCGCCSACTMETAAKDVNAVGGIDEAPDIAGADHVLACLYKLVEAEAREGAIGAHEECDLNILTEAISLMRWFRENEQYGDVDDGGLLKSADPELVCKAHRKFSSDERKSLAAEGKALPDGSYPIPDADALRRAAILARSGHGDVAAAKRLIAKRAKELGVSNPLASDAQKDAPEGVEPETSAAAEPQEGDETLTKDVVAKMIEDHVAKSRETDQKRIETLTEQLEVLKATPIPGGPALTATAAVRQDKAKADAVEKAAYYRRMAASATDREAVSFYRTKLAEAELAAK